MSPVISVIICTKDRFLDFKATVASLVKQTRLPDELIVVDSSGKTLVHDYLTSSNIPVIFRHVRSTPGLTLQRNIGIEKSQGELVFFFDDDVDVEMNYIELVEKVFVNDNNTSIGAVGGRISNLEQVGQKSVLYWLKRQYFNTLRYVFLQGDFGNGKFRYSGMPTHPHLQKTSGYIECLSGCCMAFRRQVFTIARFDEKLVGYGQLEDADISKQVLNAGYKIYYEASAVLEHKVSPRDRLKERELTEMTVLNYAYLFEKHWPQTLPRKIALYWTLLGLLMLFLHSSLGRRGVLDGIKQVVREVRV
jgi:GT2 family glycosyltransferase